MHDVSEIVNQAFIDVIFTAASEKTPCDAQPQLSPALQASSESRQHESSLDEIN